MKSTTATRRTVYFKSHSDPRQETYMVKRCGDGKIVCTCLGYLYRQQCKHATAAKTWK